MSKKFDRSKLPPAPNLSFERSIWQSKTKLVAGIDEAGRGALAGPVAVGAVILSPEPALSKKLSGVRDSKEMSPKNRNKWAEKLKDIALTYTVAFSSNKEIDSMGILPAIHLASKRAISQLEPSPQYLLVDYFKLPEESVDQSSLVKGDARSLSIAAASILAKVSRDNLLMNLDRKYPGYAFERNKGYGTSQHRTALDKLGPTDIHRFTFKPIKKENQND